MMRLGVFVMMLCGAVSAQASKFVTVPLGYTSKAGAGFARNFGCYASGRHQMIEGALRGQGAKKIKGVDYRLDETLVYGPSNGMGRGFSQVSLSIANCDITKLTTRFSTNVIGLATNVFVAKLTWPTISKGTGRAYGSVVAFPFSTSFTYPGDKDLLLDYTFQGGALANAASWSDARGDSWFAAYALDGLPGGGVRASSNMSYVPFSPFDMSQTQCRDSSVVSSFGAYAFHEVTAYSRAYFDPLLAGKAEALAYTYRTAPGSPVVAAIGLNGSSKGTVGFTCQNLHLPPSLIVALVYGTASSNRATAFSGGLLPGRAPYDGSLSGIQTWFQAAWIDSKTQHLSLGIAHRQTLPPRPLDLQKRCVHRNNLKNPDGFAVYDFGELQSLPRLQIE